MNLTNEAFCVIFLSAHSVLKVRISEMELLQDELNEEIIEAARALAKEKSIGKITVRDILKAMNISNRVFYNRFRNIDEVLEILYHETVNKVRESLFVPWEEGTDYGDYIMQVAENTLLFSYESRAYMSQYIFETDSARPSNFEWWIREIADIIDRGRQIGYLRTDLDGEAIGYSAWCFIRGFNADALTRKLPREEALRQFRCGFGCLLEGMKAR